MDRTVQRQQMVERQIARRGIADPGGLEDDRRAQRSLFREVEGVLDTYPFGL